MCGCGVTTHRGSHIILLGILGSAHRGDRNISGQGLRVMHKDGQSEASTHGGADQEWSTQLQCADDVQNEGTLARAVDGVAAGVPVA